MMKKTGFALVAIALIGVSFSDGPYRFNPINGDFINLRKQVIFFDDFIGGTNSTGDIGENGWSWTQLNGGGIFNLPEVGRPGVKALRTNTTDSARSAISILQSAILINGDDELVISAKLSSQNTCIMRLGFGDSYNASTFPTDGLWFEVNADSGSTNYYIGASSGGVKTFSLTSKAADNQWHEYKIKVASDKSRAEFYIDRVLIGTITTNIPGSSAYTGIMCYIETTDVNSNDLYIDYVFYKVTNLAR